MILLPFKYDHYLIRKLLQSSMMLQIYFIKKSNKESFNFRTIKNLIILISITIPLINKNYRQIIWIMKSIAEKSNST